ncbi:MAG: hypothetical protein K0R71_1277 [Bacillales bacterium]|jgi:RimJ/RimL family protein N-acetyltransferase|nr:hypothetical protein [Bacillales bacterium]
MFLCLNNLTIRKACIDDAELLAKWWNDGNIMAHAGFPNGTGQNKEDIAKSLQSDADQTHRRLIMEIDNIPIGEMNYRNKRKHTAEIGIKICDFSKQDKGYGIIFLSMLINSLFKGFGYNKIILDTNLTNKRAQHVYEKIGFKKIRINFDSWKDQLGVLQSSIDYELTEKDFKNYANIL